MDKRKKVASYITRYQMFQNTECVVAGVSGGPDSMCLLHLLMDFQKSYGYEIHVVHIHHGLRGEEADEDMAFVENYCRQNDIAFHGFTYDVGQLAQIWHMSGEETGRKVRYDRFYQVLKECGKTGKIAVAHNSDDNSETFLWNLFRGSGIAGLTGIKPVRDQIIRPILCLERAEILEYLKENRIDYRTDTTNEETIYTRNKIRNRVLPYVREEINEQAGKHITQTAEHLNEVFAYMNQEMERIYGQVVERKGEQLYLPIEYVKTLHPVICKMVLRHMIEQLTGKLKDITAAHIAMILALSEGETGKKCRLPYDMICDRQYEYLRLYKEKKTKEKQEILICETGDLKENEKAIWNSSRGTFSILWRKKEDSFIKIPQKIYTKWLDYDILGDTFEIRTRREGDYIVVNRQGGRKKLKDYYIDLKIPREERDHILLVAKGSEIFWVVGYRISERCKISEKTRAILQIEYDGKEQKQERQGKI